MKKPSSRKEAIQSGATYYNTGKPCSRGHMADRYVSTSNCMACTALQRSRWKKANPEKLRKSEYKYRSTHKEQWALKSRNWSLNNPEMQMLVSARSRARRSGMECTITKNDIHIPELCPVLGLKLQKGKVRHSDSSPSLDRIDTTKGYTPDNIMVISHRANTLKGDARPDEILALARYITSAISRK